MKVLKPLLVIGVYFALCALSYGSECEELLPGEKPSGEIRVCNKCDFMPLEDDTDLEMYCRCLDELGLEALQDCRNNSYL